MQRGQSCEGKAKRTGDVGPNSWAEEPMPESTYLWLLTVRQTDSCLLMLLLADYFATCSLNHS